LGVTKGSFYWHFSDRAEAIEVALGIWEQQGTVEVVEQLESEPDPATRLRKLLEFVVSNHETGPVDIGLAVRVDDPVIGQIVRRVTKTRVGFVTLIYRELGWSPADAQRQARLAVSSYMGYYQLRAALPNDKHLSGPSRAYVDQLVALLTNRPAC